MHGRRRELPLNSLTEDSVVTIYSGVGDDTERHDTSQIQIVCWFMV